MSNRSSSLTGWAWVVSAFSLSAGCMYDYSQYDFEEAPPATTAPPNTEGAETQAEAQQSETTTPADAGTL